MAKTWEEANAEITPTKEAIEQAFLDDKPIGINAAEKLIGEITDWGVFANPNLDHTYCQFVITPPSGFTFSVGLEI